MRQRWFSRNELEDMIRGGIITDDSTITAYALYLCLIGTAHQRSVSGSASWAGCRTPRGLADEDCSSSNPRKSRIGGGASPTRSSTRHPA